MPTFETSMIRIANHEDIGTTASTLAERIDERLNRIVKSGGKVAFIGTIDVAASYNSRPEPHVMIVADMPNQPPVLSDVTPAGLWESELPGSSDFPE